MPQPAISMLSLFEWCAGISTPSWLQNTASVSGRLLDLLCFYHPHMHPLLAGFCLILTGGFWVHFDCGLRTELQPSSQHWYHESSKFMLQANWRGVEILACSDITLATCIEFASGPTPLSLAQSLSLPAQLRQSFKRDGQQLSWVLPQQRSRCHTNERIQFNGINKLYYTFKSDQICMFLQQVTYETFNFSPFLALWSKKGSLRQWCYQRIREQALMKWIRRTSNRCTKN